MFGIVAPVADVGSKDVERPPLTQFLCSDIFRAGLETNSCLR